MAKKEKFKYNPETLSYEKVEVSWGERVLKSLLIIAPAIILGFIFQFTFSSLFQSPKEIALEEELRIIKPLLEEQNKRLNNCFNVQANIQKNDDELFRTLLNAEPFDRNMGTGGSDNSDLYKKLKSRQYSALMIENDKLLTQLEKQLYSQSLSHDEIIKLAKEKEKMLACIPAIQPVSNKDLSRVASGYGMRTDPVYHTKRMHWGLDFTSKTGTKIYAPGNGKVILVERKMWGYGQSIIIDHGYGYKTRYAHLSKFNVKLGQTVKRGEVIGYVGSTGKSTGPHLHYEVEKNGKKVNPIHYFHSDLTAAEFEKMIEISKNINQSFD